MLSKIKLFDELPKDYPYHLNCNIMKPIQHLFLSLIFIFSSCITIETTSSGFKDEIYYTVDQYAQVAEKEEQEQQSFEEEQLQDSDDNEENYYDEYSSDDYYDYGYSARLRRFHGPNFGFSYYNNYYTNSFWYSGYPAHCGVSIYYGYNFWNPHYYDPFYSYYAYSPYHYNPFYYNHFYPHHHYNHHYGGIYACNSYPTYYNSYDNNSIYYGPRENNKNKTPETFANRYISQIKNRAPEQAAKVNDFDKKPNYTTQPSSVFNNKRPSSTNQNNTNLDNKVNTNYSISNNPNYSKPVSNKHTNKPTYSKPVNNNSKPISNKKPNYSKPIKDNRPDDYNKPRPSRTYSMPSFNSSPRNSSPSRGGSNNSGRRPR